MDEFSFLNYNEKKRKKERDGHKEIIKKKHFRKNLQDHMAKHLEPRHTYQKSIHFLRLARILSFSRIKERSQSLSNRKLLRMEKNIGKSSTEVQTFLTVRRKTEFFRLFLKRRVGKEENWINLIKFSPFFPLNRAGYELQPSFHFHLNCWLQPELPSSPSLRPSPSCLHLASSFLRPPPGTSSSI